MQTDTGYWPLDTGHVLGRIRIQHLGSSIAWHFLLQSVEKVNLHFLLLASGLKRFLLPLFLTFVMLNLT